MARSVYSVQLLCVAPLLPATFVECPSGVKIVLRDIDVREESGGAPTTLLVNGPAGGSFWAAQRTTAGELGFFQWRGRQVVNPGESVEFIPLSGTWSVWASGYELTLT